MYNHAVDETHNVLYVATSGGNSAGRSIIELPLSISGASMPYKVPGRNGERSAGAGGGARCGLCMFLLIV